MSIKCNCSVLLHLEKGGEEKKRIVSGEYKVGTLCLFLHLLQVNESSSLVGCARQRRKMMQCKRGRKGRRMKKRADDWGEKTLHLAHSRNFWASLLFNWKHEMKTGFLMCRLNDYPFRLVPALLLFRCFACASVSLPALLVPELLLLLLALNSTSRLLLPMSYLINCYTLTRTWMFYPSHIYLYISLCVVDLILSSLSECHLNQLQ